MKHYCRAYRLAELRRFPHWTDVAGDGEPLTDDTIVYLWNDLTVVANPVLPDSALLWDAVDDEWERFCRDDLSFDVPEELIND
jgi:hypothetical protein